MHLFKNMGERETYWLLIHNQNSSEGLVKTIFYFYKVIYLYRELYVDQ